MRIAQIAPNVYSIPPKGYGGTEFVINNITEELVQRGHEVTLFASADSETKARLHPTVDTSLTEKKDFSMSQRVVYFVDSMVEFIKNQDKFDIVHVHIEESGAVLSPLIKIPSLFTHHGIFLPPAHYIYTKDLDLLNFSALSESQKKLMPELNFLKTVYHGLDVDNYDFSQQGGDKLFFIGKIDPVKGPEKAIEVAKRTGNDLILAGVVTSSNRDFFKEKIEGQLKDGVRYIGEIGLEEKVQYLKNSRALLFPIDWEEAFGLVMIESMACGTPVIAFDRGSVSEVIENGKTGYIVEPGKVSAMTEMVEKVYSMSENEYLEMRKNCRRHVEKKFTIKKMVDGYEKLYNHLVSKK